MNNINKPAITAGIIFIIGAIIYIIGFIAFKQFYPKIMHFAFYALPILLITSVIATIWGKFICKHDRFRWIANITMLIYIIMAIVALYGFTRPKAVTFHWFQLYNWIFG